MTQYSKEEADEILRRALEDQRVDELSHAELIEVATEIGIERADVEEAARELREEQALDAERTAIVSRRKRRFWGNFFTYGAVNSLLLMADFMQGPGWWAHWVAAGWGILLVLAARPVFLPDRQKLDREAGKKLRRKQARARLQAQRAHASDLEIAVEAGVSALVEAASRHLSDDRPRRHRRRRHRKERAPSPYGVRVRVPTSDEEVIDAEVVETDEPAAAKRQR